MVFGNCEIVSETGSSMVIRNSGIVFGMSFGIVEWHPEQCNGGPDGFMVFGMVQRCS